LLSVNYGEFGSQMIGVTSHWAHHIWCWCNEVVLHVVDSFQICLLSSRKAYQQRQKVRPDNLVSQDHQIWYPLPLFQLQDYMKISCVLSRRPTSLNSNKGSMQQLAVDSTHTKICIGWNQLIGTGLFCH